MGTESASNEMPQSQVSSSWLTIAPSAESAAVGVADRRKERKRRTDSRRVWSREVLGLTFKNLGKKTDQEEEKCATHHSQHTVTPPPPGVKMWLSPSISPLHRPTFQPY